MPRKRESKTSVAKKSKPKRTTATKGGKKRASRATSQLKQTAMKVLAGAAAGAVRAIMPPLEKAAGTQGAGSKERKS